MFSCDAQRCTGEFRVEEIAAFDTCGRRPVVKSIDPQVADFLATLVGSPTPGVYTIKLPDRYWRAEVDDGGLVALLDRMKDRLVSYESRERVDLGSVGPAELRQLVEKHLDVEWLIKETEHQSVLEARRAWESEARRAHALDILLWIAYWASFVAALSWLVHSIHVFFSRLYHVPAKSLAGFASPCLAQIVIGAVGVAAAIFMPFTFWPGTLLVPVVVVVLLAEGWARFRRPHVA